jgi:TfoX/Sxy family transcriptional regulator of competence genes|tara:strand:+ start:252 stop:791 length:540 start_codon:yes stop_codon:yes gene_type:complete
MVRPNTRAFPGAARETRAGVSDDRQKLAVAKKFEICARSGHHTRVDGPDQKETVNMTMVKANQHSKDFFLSLVPDDPRVATRPMFGNLAAFVNGNMFFCLLGDSVAVRLSESERETLLEEDGAAQFEPISGRPMREYVTIPDEWRDELPRMEEWIHRSLTWAAMMPEKKPKPRKRAKNV